MFERVMKKLPLYLLLALPVSVGSVYLLGEVGAVIALAANFALWLILLWVFSENDDGVQE